MKINNLQEVIKDLDGEPIGEPLVAVNRLKNSVESGLIRSKENLIEILDKMKKSTKEYTYRKIYERAIFFDVEKVKAENFIESLELAEKLRKKDENFGIDDLKIIQDRTAKLTIEGLSPDALGMLKAFAIRNLNWEETKDKKSKDK